MTFGSYFSFISKVAIIAIITGIQIAMLRIGSLPFRYHSSPGVICKSLNKEPYPRIVRILPLIDIVSEIRYKLEIRYAKDKPVIKEKKRVKPNLATLRTSSPVVYAPIKAPINAGNKVKMV